MPNIKQTFRLQGFYALRKKSVSERRCNFLSEQNVKSVKEDDAGQVVH